ncbi:hypothetical protein H9Q13_04620 [Pontibacter sp. JH31]|uniref:Uncharacterized protein n=1 Tax=Pontibacter aquaedesilientis TaxID=2766980 RepID=A0ABR7XDR5_9BACT|nr:hypothetical protein [Pontibacter aquaedesilientis]MBD1396438.1 hypothetical protein [Pontibacter aquaedesilientis]
MTEEEFDSKYEAALHRIVTALAESPEIDPEKFYSLTCVLENLRFFSPVLYGLIKSAKEQ